jgi:hypothetical protein
MTTDDGKPRMPTAGMIRQVQGIQRMNRLFNAVIDADGAHIRSLERNRFTGKRAKAKFERAQAKQRKKGRKTYTP